MVKIMNGEITAHPIYGTDERGNEDRTRQIAYVTPADDKDADWLLSRPRDDDGRSNFVWIRFGNGDLVLAVYPQGDTYLEISDTRNV